VPFGHDAAAKGARKVKNQVLVYLAAGEPGQPQSAPPRNMTRRTT
jgi:hypothetical protein